MKTDKFTKIKKIVGIVVMITLLGSIAYVIARLLTVPDSAYSATVRSDYVLMLLQCLLGVVVMLLPGFLERKLSIDVPDYMELLYFIFLYCAIYLGEVHSFYYLIPNWDTVLHAFSGAMLGALGYSVVSIFNEAESVKMKLNPIFVALFALCFAVTIGTFWEIYEYLGDGLFGMNMQKFRDVGGNLLIGRDALRDTMDDIIVDTSSAGAVVLGGYFVAKIRENRAKKAESATSLADSTCNDD